jgi:hypothetical protein
MQVRVFLKQSRCTGSLAEVMTNFRSCVAARTLVGFAQRENGKPAEVRYPQLRLVLGQIDRTPRLSGVL